MTAVSLPNVTTFPVTLGPHVLLVAAERAQAVLVYSTEAILASPAALTAIGGMSGPDALAAMGLTMVESVDGIA
jgi:hypothetical protein